MARRPYLRTLSDPYRRQDVSLLSLLAFETFPIHGRTAISPARAPRHTDIYRRNRMFDFRSAQSPFLRLDFVICGVRNSRSGSDPYHWNSSSRSAEPNGIPSYNELEWIQRGRRWKIRGNVQFSLFGFIRLLRSRNA